MKYFTSDLHLGHEKVITFNNRPFDNVDHMDSVIINNINETCGPNDDLYILGDFTFNESRIYETTARIVPRIHLIFGNHDHKKTRKATCFDSKQYYFEVKKPHHMILCHYPMLFWNRSKHGSFMLHGHCHGAYKDDSRYIMDVGVDCHNYYPLSEDQILEEMNKRSVVLPDHHEETI